jgi:hypothetical protein
MHDSRRTIRLTSSVIAVLIGMVVLISNGVAIAAGGWSGKVKVTSIEVSDVHAPGVWVTFKPDPFAGACTGNGQYKLGDPNASPVTDPDIISKMAFTANSALLNSLDVIVYWNGNCLSHYPTLVGITIEIKK